MILGHSALRSCREHETSIGFVRETFGFSTKSKMKFRPSTSSGLQIEKTSTGIESPVRNEPRPAKATSPKTIAWLIAAFGAIALWETRRPLRRRVESRPRHAGRDLAVFAITAATTTALQRAFYRPVVTRLKRRPSTILADVLLLDYTLWIWHWLNHRVALLWRFHRVHHVDRDLDTATALRFHFGELALSVPFRIAQVLLIDPDPVALKTWERMLMASIVFHHSNVRLPWGVERRLVRLFVTPRLHGIHHSDVQEETNSNWSSLFTMWDQIQGTFRLDVPQQAITIGVPKYEDDREVTLGRILEMPLRTTSGDFRGREKRGTENVEC